MRAILVAVVLAASGCVDPSADQAPSTQPSASEENPPTDKEPVAPPPPPLYQAKAGDRVRLTGDGMVRTRVELDGTVGITYMGSNGEAPEILLFYPENLLDRAQASCTTAPRELMRQEFVTLGGISRSAQPPSIRVLLA